MNSGIVQPALILGAADFSRKVLLAATVLVCARFLDPRTFGEYVFLLSFYQIFAVLAGAGLPSALLRAVARRGACGPRFACASVLARLVYILPSVGLMCAAMRWTGFAGRYLVFAGVLAVMLGLRAASENLSFMFQGAENRVDSAKLGVSQSVVTLIATLAVCLSSKDLLLLIAAHAAGALVSVIFGFLLLSGNRIPEEESPGMGAEARNLLLDSRWLNAASFLGSAYNRADVVLLRRMSGAEAVAIYGAPYRILDFTQIVPASVVAAVLPRLCRGGASNTETAARLMRVLLVIALMLVLTITVGAPLIVKSLFGSHYDSSIAVLQVLAWATLPMFWNFVLNSQFVATFADRAIVQASGVALGVNVILNVLLIPRFGYLACALVTVLTEIVLLAINLLLSHRARIAAWPEYFGRLAASAAMLAAFCVCWTAAGRILLPLEIMFLCGLVLMVPVFRNDFFSATPGLVGIDAAQRRTTLQSATPVRLRNR